MHLKQSLESLGLSGNESKIYLSLLDLGSTLAGELTKHSGVNRTNVYDALERLIEKGLVSYVIKANRKYFEATPPKKFLSFIEEKEQQIKEKKLLITSILPELEIRRKLSKEPQEATIYKGKRGLQSITEDILSKKQPMLVFGAEGKFIDTFQHYAEQWHMRRGKLKIPIKIIFNERLHGQKIQSKFPFSQIRFTSKDESPATTWVYENNVAIIVWGEQPIATLIRSKQVAASYRTFFEVLWNNARD